MNLNTAGKSIVETLSHILKSTLPKRSETGLTKHLTHISPDPKSKGKAVIFKWNSNTFRLTENLTVAELSFFNEWQKTEECKALEDLAKTFHDKMYAVVPVTPTVNALPNALDNSI